MTYMISSPSGNLDTVYSLLLSLITIISSLKTYRQQLPQHKLAAFDNSWSRLFNSNSNNSNNYIDIKSDLLFQELKSVTEVHLLDTTTLILIINNNHYYLSLLTNNLRILIVFRLIY